MLPGSESMGAPSSFAARRPNASHLPQFELPPPQLPTFQKYQPSYYGGISGSQSTSVPTSLTSVGNLLTPPSASSGDGVSPVSAGITSGSSTSTQSMPPYTPNGYSWPQTSGTTPYGFHSSMSPSAFIPPRGLFSPSLNLLGKGNNSPSAGDALPPPPPYNEIPPFPTSMSMSSSISLPALPSQGSYSSQTAMSAPVTQASPVNGQDAYTRQPPTPTYYHGSSTAPPQSPYPYSAGPSPIQQSPVSTGGPLSRMSPANASQHIPSIHSQASQSQYTQQRPYSYSLPGPVLSNVNNPNSQLALVGGMHTGMVNGYNSGHAAQMHQLYGQPQPTSNLTNDRPFKCDQCPQSFNRNHDLKRHKRIHLAVKPFPCGHCDKSFSRKDALKVSTISHDYTKACTDSFCRDTSLSRAAEKLTQPVKATSLTAPSLLPSRATWLIPVLSFTARHED